MRDNQRFNYLGSIAYQYNNQKWQLTLFTAITKGYYTNTYKLVTNHKSFKDAVIVNINCSN